MERQRKTEAIRIENGQKVDVRLDDFAPTHNLGELHQRLRLYEDELDAISNWIKEEFHGEQHDEACKKLETAKQALQKLEKSTW